MSNNCKFTVSTNKLVALLPFQKEAPAKTKGLDFTDMTTTKLIESKVLFDSENFKAGEVLYFRSDILKLPYVNQQFQLDDKIFILAPEELVVLRRYND